jgi:hypothetical protein
MLTIPPLLATLWLLPATAGALPDAAARQAALVRALIDVGEAARRGGRLGECLRVLDAGGALVSQAEAQPADRTRLALQRARCAYHKASLAGAPLDDAIRDLRGAERFRSAAREALAGLEASPPTRP